jgi:uncharacterized protein
MSLKTQIVEELTAAMKAGEELKKEVLRMLKAEVMKEEVSGSEKRELGDADIIKIVKRMVKQRKDSIEQFEKGGRTELAEKEKTEIPILEAYLPAQMSKEDIVAIVMKKKAELGVDDKSKMGMLIGAVMKEVGDSAEGNIVKGIVEQSF